MLVAIFYFRWIGIVDFRESSNYAQTLNELADFNRIVDAIMVKGIKELMKLLE